MSDEDIWQYSINFMFAFLHTSILYGSSSHGQEVELHQSSSLSISLLVNYVFLLIVWYQYCQNVFSCRVWLLYQHFFIGITITGRPLFQCLCVECYLAVVHPVTFLKFKPLRYRVICSTMVWIITRGSCLDCMFISVLYNFNGYMWIFSTESLLFLSIQLFCSLAVLRALKQSGPGERRRNHMKRKAFHLILIYIVSMGIIFVPNIFAGFFTIFRQLHTDPLISFAFACFILGGFVHPVLFLHWTGKLSCVCSS